MDFVRILINLKMVQEPTQEKVSPETTKIDPKYTGGGIGRNEPCPCGSGKKYKKCCGAL